MSERTINCPHCRESVEAPLEIAGMNAECPTCGKNFIVPGTSSQSISPPTPTRIKVSKVNPPQIKLQAPSAPTIQHVVSPPAKMEVVVTDIHMGFFSMVIFMVKWVIAAIPAFIILVVLGSFAFAFLSVFIAGCASALHGIK